VNDICIDLAIIPGGLGCIASKVITYCGPIMLILCYKDLKNGLVANGDLCGVRNDNKLYKK